VVAVRALRGGGGYAVDSPSSGLMRTVAVQTRLGFLFFRGSSDKKVR
jgi:hypothetical protein